MKSPIVNNCLTNFRIARDSEIIAKASGLRESSNEDLATELSVRGIIRLTMPLAAGTKLDGYEIVGLLGAGGMGEVYRARDVVLKPTWQSRSCLPSFPGILTAFIVLNRKHRRPRLSAIPTFLRCIGLASLKVFRIWFPSC